MKTPITFIKIKNRLFLTRKDKKIIEILKGTVQFSNMLLHKLLLLVLQLGHLKQVKSLFLEYVSSIIFLSEVKIPDSRINFESRLRKNDYSWNPTLNSNRNRVQQLQ